MGDVAPGRIGAVHSVYPSVVLLAATERGYENLMKLSSLAYLSPQIGETPHVAFQTIADSSDGVIVLSGGSKGPVDRALLSGQGELAETRLKRLHAVFGDRLYVEIQRHGLADETTIEADLIDLAYRLELPLVATNEAYFAKPTSYAAHDALLAIADGLLVSDPERRRVTAEHDFKSRAAMKNSSRICRRPFPIPSKLRCVAPSALIPVSRFCQVLRRATLIPRSTRQRPCASLRWKGLPLGSKPMG